jgi:uncharacterized membrane protein YgdD (TMEM256/DUF423 family)
MRGEAFPMDRVFLVVGALFALLAVAAGAFGAHVAAARLPAERLATLELAARYQMYHALALVAAAWAAHRWPGATATAAGVLFVVGILLFSGSLYALSLGAPRWLAMITPFGGTSFLLGWLALAWTAWRGAA